MVITFHIQSDAVMVPLVHIVHAPTVNWLMVWFSDWFMIEGFCMRSLWLFRWSYCSLCREWLSCHHERWNHTQTQTSGRSGEDEEAGEEGRRRRRRLGEREGEREGDKKKKEKENTASGLPRSTKWAGQRLDYIPRPPAVKLITGLWNRWCHKGQKKKSAATIWKYM